MQACAESHATSTSRTGPAPALPTGLVTLLFSDIEGSTERWKRYPETMKVALRKHDALLNEAIASNGEHVFKTIGGSPRAARALGHDITSGNNFFPSASSRGFNAATGYDFPTGWGKPSVRNLVTVVTGQAPPCTSVLKITQAQSTGISHHQITVCGYWKHVENLLIRQNGKGSVAAPFLRYSG